MKKRWLSALAACMYVIQIVWACVLFTAGDGSSTSAATNVIMILVLLFIVLSLVFVIINILCAIGLYAKKVVPDKNQNTFKTVMQFKIALIPFYVINFIVWLIVAIVFLNPFLLLYGGWVIWIFIYLAALFTYVTLLATSSYTIAQIIVLKQKGAITFTECTVCILLHLFFVADVAASVYLYVKYKNYADAAQQTVDNCKS